MGWSIRKKLIIFLMIVTVLPFGAAITITYYHTKESLKDRFVSTNHDVIENGKQDITTYLKDIARITSALYTYSPLMNALRDGVSSDLEKNQQEVNRILLYLYSARPEIEQLHLYIHEGKDSYTNYHWNVSGRGRNEDIFSHPYYFQLITGHNYTEIEPPHEIYSYNNLSAIPQSEKKKVLSFHNIIKNIPAEDFLGFLSIDINLSQLSAISDRLYTKEAEDFYIMNENGVIMYSSEEKLIGTENIQTWFQHVKKAPSSSHSLEWKDKQFSGVIVHERFSAPFQEWYIVKRIPYDLLYQSARETAFINILIGLVTLLIVVLATMLISFKFTSPIKVLIANMKKVEKGEFQADFDSLGNDEFGMLGRHFKLMIATINDLIQREYKLELENKRSQLRVLHSQINPHFLYNALQSIGTLALKHKAVQVYALLTSLSKIMRYSLNMKDDIVPLTQEVQHVKDYLALQKQRFGEQLQYELHIQPELEDIFVPKMILQPIVENCFKHGFDQQTETALIRLEAQLQDDEIVHIHISDNGKGMNNEQVTKLQRELLEQLPTDEKQGESIGLKNIYDRLQIYYNHEAKMGITSDENRGFTVTIELPKTLSKEVHSS